MLIITHDVFICTSGCNGGWFRWHEWPLMSRSFIFPWKEKKKSFIFSWMVITYLIHHHHQPQALCVVPLGPFVLCFFTHAFLCWFLMEMLLLVPTMATCLFSYILVDKSSNHSLCLLLLPGIWITPYTQQLFLISKAVFSGFFLKGCTLGHPQE